MRLIHNILHSRSSKDGDFLFSLQELLGFSPKNINYYKRAFAHPSFHKKDETGKDINYERLEFLGDAILGSVVAAYLFEELPNADEGQLTEMRSKIVSRQHLNKLGKEFGLINFMESCNHTEHFGENIHGNLFEALIGAIYEDCGYRKCLSYIIRKVINPYVDIQDFQKRIISYKSYLIEWCQKEKKTFDFLAYEDSGKEKPKHFSVKLSISGKVIAKARSTSKKKAEEKAARRAYYSLKNIMEH